MNIAVFGFQKFQGRRRQLSPIRRLSVILSLLVLTALSPKAFGGTWAALAHAPPAGLNNGLLMSDGTVMCGDGGSGWYRLTPDANGSYVNGTWSILASTHYTRLFYSSDVLTNGNLYVAGGEYGTGKDRAELYDSIRNTWTDIPSPASDPVFSDAVSKILPNGNVLQGTTGGGVWIYNVVANTITAAASARNQNEACWVKLQNDCVLTIDAFGQQSEHYVPSLNQWVNDNNTPQDLFGYGGELGAGFLLPNGNVFYIGASTHTAIYTPGSTVTTAGTWVSGPEMIFGTNSLGAVDAPAAMMVDGKILCALGPTNGFNGPTSFYEYDYTTNGFSQVNAPSGGLTSGGAPFGTSMLDLADGSVLFISGQGTTSLYVYTPSGPPLAAGQPAINTITENTDGSYHLTGTGLNGISGGAAYGDDWQMDSNYPLVRMTNNLTGAIYYARTYGWNSTSVMTGSKIVTTEFTLPPGIPPGTYSLVVSANGNPSVPFTFNYAPPAAPPGLTAVIGNTQLRLSWNAVSGATAYDLKRSTNGSAIYTTLATVFGTNFTDAGLINGMTYYYEVVAVGSGGPSANSAPLAVAPFGPPPAPTGLAAGPDGNGTVGLVWNPSTVAVTYKVKRSLFSSGPFGTLATQPNNDFHDTNASVGTTFFYTVSAVSAGGESANSAVVAATPSGTGDVTNGLVGYWKFDEGTGTTTADSSGNNNTGTLVNSPNWITPGRIGASALSFVGTNSQQVTVPGSGSLNVTTGITITAWINSIDWSSNRRILQKGASDNQYRFLVENGVLKFNLTGVNNTLVCAVPPTNVWIHMAATYDGTNMIVYTNGVVQASLAASGTILTTTDGLAIGNKPAATVAANYFNGLMDEVRLYNRALNVVELNTVMHAGDSAPGAPPGLVAVASNAAVNLSWTDLTNATKYNIKRSTTNGGPYLPVGSTFAPRYADAGLTNGTAYYYVVTAVTFTNESGNSSQVSATPGIGVEFFQDINYGGAAGQILGAGNYVLSQLVAAGIPNDWASSCTMPAGWTASIYQNDNFGGTIWTLTANTPLFTAYSGLNDNMSSCKIVAPTLPSAPGGLSGVAGDSVAGLSWGTNFLATSYNLKRSLTNGGPYVLLETTTGTNFFDTGLTNGTTYYYVISASGVAGESANSGPVSVTPTPPTVPVTLGGDSYANGQFTFQFQGVDGQSYVILMSTDLMNWTPVYTNVQSGGLFIYTDTNATNTAQFYQVQQQ